jgi:predicted aconitase with swiveling domain
VAVDGHFQTRDRQSGQVVEVTAEHITFLEGIDWASGMSAQHARLPGEKVEVMK